MINWDRVAELKNEIGSDDFDEVVELFVEEVEEVLNRLRATPDLSKLESDLHLLKGSALNLGFEAFSRLCRDGEYAAAAGNGESVDLAAVFTSYEQSRSSLLDQD